MTLIFLCSSVIFAKESDSAFGTIYQNAIQAENNQKYNVALGLFKQAIIKAQSQKNIPEQIESLYGEIRIYQKLNRGADAFQVIKRLEELSALINDNTTLIRNYRTLAIAYQSIGRNEIARDYYAVAVETAREQKNQLLLASLLNEQAYADTLVPDIQNALTTFEESKNLYKKLNETDLFIDTSLNQLHAEILSNNKLNTLYSFKELDHFFFQSEISNRGPSQLLRLGLLYRAAHIKFNLDGEYRKKSYTFYNQAKEKSRKNSANYAYATGYLGQLYSDEGRYAEAISFTQQAINISENNNLLLMQFKWQLQLARAYDANKEPVLSEFTYGKAIDILEKTGVNDFIILDKSFEQDIEPVFKEYINITLINALRLESDADKTKAFVKALSIHHIYNTYEVKAYCRSSCNITTYKKPMNLVKGKAVIAPFLLKEQLLTLSIIDKSIQYDLVKISNESFQLDRMHLLESIRKKDSNSIYKEQADKFYRWMVKPFIKEINKGNINEIVFLNNNLIGEIPYHVLKGDGRYLIEDFTISLATNIYDIDTTFYKNIPANIEKYSKVVTDVAESNTDTEKKISTRKIWRNNYRNKYSGILDIDAPISIKSDYRDSVVTFDDLSVNFTSFLYDEEKIKLDCLIQRNIKSDNFRQILNANALINSPFFLAFKNSTNLMHSDEFVNEFISNLKVYKNHSLAYQKSIKWLIKKNKVEKSPAWPSFGLINQSYYSQL